MDSSTEVHWYKHYSSPQRHKVREECKLTTDYYTQTRILPLSPSRRGTGGGWFASPFVHSGQA